MGTQLVPRVDNRWQSLEALPGDVEMSTVWPGGSDQLSWTPGLARTTRRFLGGENTDAMFGPVAVFAGALSEPDPSQEQVSAQGAWRDADRFVALDSGGNATKIPDTAIDQAITRGLRWNRPSSISSSAVDIDTTQGPVTVGSLLDSWSEQSGQRWAVNPSRQVYAKADDTTPTYQTFPLAGGLGYALDSYASTLVGRYYNGTSYLTTTQTDTVAEAAHGHREALVDLTPRGTLTLAKANTILQNLLKFGRAVPQWTSGISFVYGELLSMGGTPVALETVRAEGNLLRVHGGFDLTQRGTGRLYLDVPIGRTQLAGGVLTITPAQATNDNLADLLTAAVARKR